MKTWIADVPNTSIQAKTIKEARAKIEKKFKPKKIVNLRLETPPK